MYIMIIHEQKWHYKLTKCIYGVTRQKEAAAADAARTRTMGTLHTDQSMHRHLLLQSRFVSGWFGNSSLLPCCTLGSKEHPRIHRSSITPAITRRVFFHPRESRSAWKIPEVTIVPIPEPVETHATAADRFFLKYLATMMTDDMNTQAVPIPHIMLKVKNRIAKLSANEDKDNPTANKKQPRMEATLQPKWFITPPTKGPEAMITATNMDPTHATK